ncbi:DUF2911 domain-containing protein [Candidatus Saccharibacteria bacterium]|nr:DUF2911 domain-containing protein [Candidatus Saccharibacteria bacterium]NIV03888.1 DUF2911 domain-containing protein [Calditrichia bacterium]NIV72083.1 DUF2911 domain-containing protein [Calditrichia bacterium]NIV99164.1 DUF2911 domain-containing protein [Candidatus Saccharibacteria bacterium]NIW80924.1 DUF2911 domain-containing protein [Calditrichia bacterium]
MLSFLLAASLAGESLLAQKLPRLSPSASVSQTIGLTDVTITYSRPGVKGREIWGGLVPYDKIWRTGANEATTISFSDDAKINGQPIAAGKYALFTIPGKEEWTIIFNKEHEQWGTYNYNNEKDALRIQVKPETVSEHQERMAFSFTNLQNNSATVELRWENLRVPFNIQVNVHEKAMANAREAMANLEEDDWGTAYSCASYCLESGKNLEEGLEWVNKSISIKENYLNLSAKAKLLAKLGRQQDAIAAAEKAIKVGKASEDGPDTAEMENLLSEWKQAM